MSDNLRRYRAIRDALTHAYPTPPTGNFARHVQTLAALISGIVGSKSTQLPTIATKVPDGTKPESRVQRFARWLDNAHILEEVYFLQQFPLIPCKPSMPYEHGDLSQHFDSPFSSVGEPCRIRNDRMSYCQQAQLAMEA